MDSIATTKKDLGVDKTFYEQIVEYCNEHFLVLVEKDVWEDAKKALTTKNDLGVDCVSRQEVDRLARIYLKEPTDNHVAFYEDFLDLPSVTPIRPKGHWINKSLSFESCSAECSACHNRSNGYMLDNGFSLECKYYDFCPNCGADNREVEK